MSDTLRLGRRELIAFIDQAQDGLVEVDRATFRRTPQPSAWHFGAIARANRI